MKRSKMMEKKFAALLIPALAFCLGATLVLAQSNPANPGTPDQNQPNTNRPQPGMPGPTNPNGSPERNNRRPGSKTPDATPTPTPNTPEVPNTPNTPGTLPNPGTPHTPSHL
jgi:hypothetical protein